MKLLANFFKNTGKSLPQILIPLLASVVTRFTVKSSTPLTIATQQLNIINC